MICLLDYLLEKKQSSCSNHHRDIIELQIRRARACVELTCKKKIRLSITRHYTQRHTGTHIIITIITYYCAYIHTGITV